MSISYTFDSDIQKFVLRRLADFTKNDRQKKKLSSLAIRELLYKYFDYLGRLIPETNFNVYLSNELKLNSLYCKYTKTIQHIISRFQKGWSLYPYLSRDIENILFNDDYLLLSGGFYHLHLGNSSDPKNPPFVKRTDDLLIAHVNTNGVYLIDIKNHSDETFYNLESSYKIIHNNWSRLLRKLNGIHPGKDLPIESKKTLASKNVGRSIKIGNEMYMPLGSMPSMSGIPFKIIREVDQLQYRLKKMMEHIENVIIKEFKGQKDLCFGLIFDEKKVLKYKLVEKNTKTLINLIESNQS